METVPVEFNNLQGQKISARLDLPEKSKPIAYAVLAHGFTLSKNLKAVKHIAGTLNQRGIAVLRFDFTGLGESEGDFSDTNFCSNVEDIHSACDYLKTNHESPQIMIGHSLGGAAILSAKEKVSSVKAVVTIGSPANPEHVKEHFKHKLEKIKEEGKAEVKLGGKEIIITIDFLTALEETNLKGKLKVLDAALLVLHSPTDSIVSIENAASIYKAAHHPKSFVTLDGADHLLTKKRDSEYAGEVIATWCRRYIDLDLN